MGGFILEFERPIVELEKKIAEMKTYAADMPQCRPTPRRRAKGAGR